MVKIAELIEGVQDLVPLPKSYMRIQELVNDPDSSLEEVTKVIVNDAALTSRILRIANSAYMALASKVDTVGRAVQVLGLNQVHDLALAGAAVGSLTKLDCPALDIADHWRRSVYCAVVARLLCKDKRVGAPERLFVSGLLHDTGHLLLAYREPDLYREILKESITTTTPIHLVESKVLGFNYAELSAALLESWQLPDAIVEPVALHIGGNWEMAQSRPEEVAVLHIGSVIARAAMWRSEEDEPVPAFDEPALERHEVDDAGVESIMHEADDAIIEAMTLLMPNTAPRRANPKTASAA